VNVKLYRVSDAAVLPQRQTRGSFGYDVTITDALTVPEDRAVLASTGWVLAGDLSTRFVMNEVSPDGRRVPAPAGEVPCGMGMFILPRSSLPLKMDLIVPNSPGLVDADYSAEIKVLLRAFAGPVMIAAGTRIAQLVFPLLALPTIEEVEGPDGLRGERAGFGSTG
jgi:dUTP pyrophosphatase